MISCRFLNRVMLTPECTQVTSRASLRERLATILAGQDLDSPLTLLALRLLLPFTRPAEPFYTANVPLHWLEVPL